MNRKKAKKGLNRPRGKPFKPGQPGGPGRPKGSTRADLNAAFREKLGPAEVREIAAGLLRSARRGSVPAARELLARLLGVNLDGPDLPEEGAFPGRELVELGLTGADGKPRRLVMLMSAGPDGQTDLEQLRAQTDAAYVAAGYVGGLSWRGPDPTQPAHAADQPPVEKGPEEGK